MKRLLSVSKEVAKALNQGRGVVALETAVVTHGLPFPQNVDLAQSMEEAVRSEGGVPATIGLLEGRIRVGMDWPKLRRLGTHPNPAKVSIRDIGFVLAKGQAGGTTVAATAAIAEMAGIRVFATGGIGGVHRGGETSWDVSADLEILGRTRIAVVCAGAKSVLDIPRTLEYLETKGVAVIGYGCDAFPGFWSRDSGSKAPLSTPHLKDVAAALEETKGVAVIGYGCDAFPGFWSRDSGSKAPLSTPHLKDVAAALEAGWDSGLCSGAVIACPIPVEAEVSGIEAHIKDALREAEAQGIEGREVTPFLLSRIKEMTSGASMTANIALLENNGRIAGQLANLLAKISSPSSTIASKQPELTHQPSTATISTSDSTTTTIPTPDSVNSDSPRIKSSVENSTNSPPLPLERPEVVVVGGCNLDVMLSSQDEKFKEDGGSYIGKREYSAGGVGRNMADALTRLGVDTLLVSAIGDDADGERMRHLCRHMDMSSVRSVPDHATPSYTAFLHKGDVRFGLQTTGMEVLESLGKTQWWTSAFASAKLVVIDANLSKETIRAVAETASDFRVPVWFEPTDQSKVVKFRSISNSVPVSYMSPNANECLPLFFYSNNKEELEPTEKLLLKVKEHLHVLRNQPSHQNLRGVLVTLGPKGLVSLSKNGDVWDGEIIPAPQVDVVSASGAGDCLNAGVIAGLLSGASWNHSLELGLAAAAASLRSHLTVPEELGDVRKSFDTLPMPLQEKEHVSS